MSRHIVTKVACINWGQPADVPRAMIYQFAIGDTEEQSEMLGMPQYFQTWAEALEAAHLRWGRWTGYRNTPDDLIMTWL